MNCFHLVKLVALMVFYASTATGLPVPTPYPDSTYRLLSIATGSFVAITKSGRVHANGSINHKNPAKDATPLIFQRILNEGQSHLRIGSVKYSDRSWFIVITAEDKIRAAAPSSGNEILEELNVADGIIALRVVNYSDIVNAMPNHGSGSSLESDDSNLLLPDIDMNSSDRECYIGFSSENGRAQCYDNPNNINVRMNIIPVAA